MDGGDPVTTDIGPAVFSQDRKYRYLLGRQTGPNDQSCLFIMLNPSTADETQNDPTVRRCEGFSALWGYGNLVVANIFAFRSTSPLRLAVQDDPVGPENDYWIMRAAKVADKVILAWGNWGEFRGRGNRVRGMLDAENIEYHHFGLTKANQPRHPLYLRKDQELISAP